MIDAIKQLDSRFSETILSEFAHEENSIGYNQVITYLQNHESDFTELDLQLIRQVVKRDCEIYGW